MRTRESGVHEPCELREAHSRRRGDVCTSRCFVALAFCICRERPNAGCIARAALGKAARHGQRPRHAVLVQLEGRLRRSHGALAESPTP